MLNLKQKRNPISMVVTVTISTKTVTWFQIEERTTCGRTFRFEVRLPVTSTCIYVYKQIDTP